MELVPVSWTHLNEERSTVREPVAEAKLVVGGGGYVAV